MRAKWNVLVCGAGENQAADLAWCINLQKHFRGYHCGPDDLAERVSAIHDLRAVILLATKDEAACKAMAETALFHKRAPVIVTGASNALFESLSGPTVMLPPGANRADLIEQLRVTCTRRRGPKKQKLTELAGKRSA